MARVLVTGGAGYFGEVLTRRLLADGHQVRIFDLNRGQFGHQVEQAQGDIRDAKAVAAACRDVEVIHHNVAQVPLANNAQAFWSVNKDGTAVMLGAARQAGVRKVIYTSSSAVFGVPRDTPVTRRTVPQPGEEYGRAKLAGETLCREASEAGLDVSIIRPRTILGHGRLGIFQILFDWIANGQPVPVFDAGAKSLPVRPREDLASACVAANERPGFAVYNIGSEIYGTMRGLLMSLIAHSNTGSTIKSLPMRPLQLAMTAINRLGLSPLGPYHAMMYGRTMFFDIGDAKRELGYAPEHPDADAICESYDWYLANKSRVARAGLSHHKSAVKKGVVALAPHLLRFLPGGITIPIEVYPLRPAETQSHTRRAA